MIKELAVIHVQSGKNYEPDMLTELIKCVSKNEMTEDDHETEFSVQCFFPRQGDW